jgi:hypothetical protein
MHQKIKTFSLYFIKRLFKRILFFTLFILLPNNFVVAEANDLEDHYCDVNKIRLLEKNNNSVSFKDKNFNQVIYKLGKNIEDKNYNLLVSAGEKPSSGYKLEFTKIKKKKKFNKLYFKEIIPKKNSKNLTVITYPYCVLKVKNLDNYKIKIKKKRLKFFPVSIF